jgi:hypothetical protein
VLQFLYQLERGTEELDRMITDTTHVHSPANWDANSASDDECTGTCTGPTGCGAAITRTGYDRWDANTAEVTSS